MRIALLLLLGAGAGCGDRASRQDAPTTNQIERLSTPKPETGDPEVSARLQPIMRADLAPAGLAGTTCLFSQGGRIYLAVVRGTAVVRISGRTRHLAQTGPMAASGAFFEDREVSVSIGRTDKADERPDDASSWAARITVTNRQTEVRRRGFGTWSCQG